MNALLEKTAWTMTKPEMFSAFHILLASGCILAAFFAAKKLRNCRKAGFNRILFACGLLLTVTEGYKQLFLYDIVNHGRYDWWYFPFQLCSLPMYFCLMVPFLGQGRLRTAVLTFMQDFNLLGGIFALAVPEGYLHTYWTLTLHGFFWHGMLVFLGLLIGFSGQGENTAKGYLRTIPLFGICCLIASLINILTPIKGEADMFYISPYYPTSQIVFHDIAETFGIMAGNLSYLLAVCLGGYLVHLSFCRIFPKD